MGFTEIESQEFAVGIIRRAIRASRVPHAYLFSGPAGVGKHLTARALAMALNCEQETDDPCLKCRSCGKVERNIHPDVILVEPLKNKKRIGVDSIREFLTRFSSRPHEGRAKVAIVDPADAMTDSAANALLKTLEEPRPGAFIVLITNKPSSLLSTVRSRCQQIRFRALPKHTIEDLLVRSGCDAQKAAFVATICNGSMDLAATYLSQDLEERVASALGLLWGSVHPTPKSGLSVAASVSGRRDQALDILDLTVVMLEEILNCKFRVDEARGQVFLGQTGEDLTKLAQEMSTKRVAQFVAAVHQAEERIENNNMNPQLAIENMLLCMRGRSGGSPIGSGFGTI